MKFIKSKSFIFGVFATTLIVGLIFIFSPSSANALSEDDFPETLNGLPLYFLYEEDPSEHTYPEIVEGWSADYLAHDGNNEIVVLFWRFEDEQSAQTREGGMLAEIKADYTEIFANVDWDITKTLSVKGYQATSATYRAYNIFGEYLDAGLVYVAIREYMIVVNIMSFEGKPSSSELESAIGVFIDKIPGEPPPSPEIEGCTDPNALNYNPEATKDDDSCKYEEFLPDLRVSFLTKTINLELGGSTTLEMALINLGKGTAEGVNFTILVDKPEVVGVYPSTRNLGDIEPGEELSEDIEISVRGSGTAYLAFHIRGDNLSSTMKFVQVNVPEAAALDVPESIFLLPEESQGISMFLTNAGSEPFLVHNLTMESLNPSVISIEEGATMTVAGQGGGIEQDQVITTESGDITNCISPKPRIKAQSKGETEILVKMIYYFPGISTEEGKTLEKRIKVKVGDLRGGKKAGLELKIKPSGLAVEKDEAREVEVTIVNTGSETIREGKITLIKSSEAPFEATYEVKFGYIDPGKTAEAKIEIIGHPQFPSGLDGKDLVVTGTLTFKGQYTTVDDREFTFEDEMDISLVGERKKCGPADTQCNETVNCFVSISNEMGCALEFADIIPYFDKPVAVVLATSDVCEIADRVGSGDAIGAAISALLMTVDVGDNALDAIPGAGNILSTFVDMIEGAADCTEGFIHDAVDTYCAGGTGRGYTGCAERLFGLIAVESNRWEQPKSAKYAVVAVGGSPITLGVVDDDGKELGLSDGVLVIEKGELKFVFIKNPTELTNGYNFQVNGIGEGAYDLQLAVIGEGKIIEQTELKDQPINLDETIEIPLAVETEDGKLTGLLVGEEAEKAKEAEGRKGILKYVLIALIAIVVIGVPCYIIWRKKASKKPVSEKPVSKEPKEEPPKT